MPKLVINGFEFPNELQEQCAIARFCERIYLSESKVWISDWKYSFYQHYKRSTVDSFKFKHAKYFDHRSKNYAGGKIFTRLSDVDGFNGRVAANEFTIQIANMLPQLERTRKEKVEKRITNRKSRIERILTPSDFIPGDIVMQNKDVYSLTATENSIAGYPDSYYILDKDQYRNPLLSYDSRKKGIYMGQMQITLTHKVERTAAIIMWFDKSEPQLVDIRGIKKVQ